MTTSATVTTRTLASGTVVLVDESGRVVKRYPKGTEVPTIAQPPARHECDCYGTGLYYGHGYFENGRFKGTSGTCYRCHGKGYQTDADVKRNNYYDNHVRRLYT
jgi:hypothetical protein